MFNYPLLKNAKNKTFLTPRQQMNTDEYCDRTFALYLHGEIYRDDTGKLINYYRLRTQEPHTIEMALAYDIRCPKCTGMLKKVTRCNSQHDLGLYTCPTCNKNR